MGHYDEYYERRDAEERAGLKELQAKCEHLYWDIAAVTQQGEITCTRCRSCGILYNIKEDRFE